MNNFDRTFQQAIDQYKEELLRAYRRTAPPESTPPTMKPAAANPQPATPSMTGRHVQGPEGQPVSAPVPAVSTFKADEAQETISPSMLRGRMDEFNDQPYTVPAPVTVPQAIGISEVITPSMLSGQTAAFDVEPPAVVSISFGMEDLQALISPSMLRGRMEGPDDARTVYAAAMQPDDETMDDMISPSMLRDHTLPMDEQPPAPAQPPEEMPGGESVIPYPAPEESEPDESMPPEPLLMTETEPVPIRFPHFVRVQAQQRPLTVPTVRSLGQTEDEDPPYAPSRMRPADLLIVLPEQPEEPVPPFRETQPLPPSPGYRFHVMVTTAQETQPVSGARVIIARPDKTVGALQTDTEVILRVSSTDVNGSTPEIELPLAEITPVYIVEVSSPGYETVRQEHTPVTSGITTSLPVELSPQRNG